MFELGLDTLGFHRALSRGESTVERVIDDVASLGVRWLRIQRYHLGEEQGAKRLEAIGERCRVNGIRLVWSGDSLGECSWPVAEGVARIAEGIEQATLVGAPILRMFPSWFRHEALASGRVGDELRYLEALFEAAAPLLEGSALSLALENHANVTAEELASLLSHAGSPQIGVHLDVTNPFAVFENPVATVATLAPFATSADVKDIAMDSEWATGNYHRRGFMVRYCWPGEGVFPLADALEALRSGARRELIPLIIEGLDEPADPIAKAKAAIGWLEALLR